MSLTIDLRDDEVALLAALRSESAKQPVSQAIREIWADMPDDVRAKLPRDGASQIDHYIYGLPKREP